MFRPLRKWQLGFAMGLLASNGLEFWSMHQNNDLFQGWSTWTFAVLIHLVAPATIIYWLQKWLQTSWLTALMRGVFWLGILAFLVGARSAMDLFNPGVIGGIGLAWFLLYGSEIYSANLPAHLSFLRKRGRSF